MFDLLHKIFFKSAIDVSTVKKIDPEQKPNYVLRPVLRGRSAEDMARIGGVTLSIE